MESLPASPFTLTQTMATSKLVTSEYETYPSLIRSNRKYIRVYCSRMRRRRVSTMYTALVSSSLKWFHIKSKFLTLSNIYVNSSIKDRKITSWASFRMSSWEKFWKSLWMRIQTKEWVVPNYKIISSFNLVSQITSQFRFRTNLPTWWKNCMTSTSNNIKLTNNTP